MDENFEQLRRLVGDPAETLSVELKAWMLPSLDETKEKIIKGSFAIRNRDGGFLIFGIDNKTRKIDSAATSDGRSIWIEDEIQTLISRFASEPFEINLRFVSVGNIDIPVLGIPSGVRTPVALKKPLGKHAEGSVFFRTLGSGGVVSTSMAKFGDWPDIMQICYNNRDADIGAFIRRHLADVDIASIGRSFSDETTPKLSLQNSAKELLDEGLAFFTEVSPNLPKLRFNPSLGAFEVAMRMDPPIVDGIADENMRRTLRAADPRLPGSFIWYEAPGYNIFPSQMNSRWTNIVAIESFWDYCDVMFVEPLGAFYQHRLLPTDAASEARGAKRGISIEPGVAVADVAEAIVTGLSYARALRSNLQGAKSGFYFRWSGLKGRRLTDWSGELMLFSSEYRAIDPHIESYVEVPMDTETAAIVPIAEKAIRPLLAAFNGYVLKSVFAAKRIADRLQR